MGDPDEGGRFIHQLLRLDIDLVSLRLIRGLGAEGVEIVELLALPALPVPLADLGRGEPLGLEARIELAGIFDQRELQILAGVLLAQRPIGARIQGVDLDVDSDLGEVGLDDGADGLIPGIRGQDRQRRLETAPLPRIGQKLLGGIDIALIGGRLGPIADDARRQQRVRPGIEAGIGAGENAVDIDAQPQRLANPQIVEGLLLDIGAEPDIVDALELRHAGIRQSGEGLLVVRLDPLEVDLAGLEGDVRGLLLLDRLADDLLEVGLDGALVVRVDLEDELLARLPFLQHIGAAADGRAGEFVAELLESLLRDDAARTVGQGDDPERRGGRLQDDLARERAGHFHVIEGRPIAGVVDLLA